MNNRLLRFARNDKLTMNRTPFFEKHLALGGKMVDFFGWELPVQYSSIAAEHAAVRTHAGLFDISHMGQVFAEGPDAESYLQKLVTSDIRKAGVSQGIYGHFLNERGGVIDDLFVFRLEPQKFLLIVNASRKEADLAWMKSHLPPQNVQMNEALQSAGLALQGPLAQNLMEKLCPPAAALGHHRIGRFEIGDKVVFVSRTGYTGEDGFELFAPAGNLLIIWDLLMQTGKGLGLQPCGLGARDTLRTEAAYPLYGHELDEEHTPLEAGLGWVVHFDKGDFLGRDALLKQKSSGIKRKLTGFKIQSGGVARPGGIILYSGNEISAVTSGTFSPTLGQSIGMSFLPVPLAKEGNELTILMGTREMPAVTCQLPFYKRETSSYRRKPVSR
ncbi:MAG: glycine cleavage system aminomethyltransferase GcvT [Elusimicrobia bacterium]|nr:glycine cleavage system aminomethyltransferase GcvT [Candidatus Obscuribacterium magneticum]